MQRHLALRRAAGADQISAFRTSSALFVPLRLSTMLPVNNNRFAISAAPNFWCASASSRSSLTRVRGALSERRESTYFFFSKISAAEINRRRIFLYIPVHTLDLIKLSAPFESVSKGQKGPTPTPWKNRCACVFLAFSWWCCCFATHDLCAAYYCICATSSPSRSLLHSIPLLEAIINGRGVCSKLWSSQQVDKVNACRIGFMQPARRRGWIISVFFSLVTYLISRVENNVSLCAPFIRPAYRVGWRRSFSMHHIVFTAMEIDGTRTI